MCESRKSLAKCLLSEKRVISFAGTEHRKIKFLMHKWCYIFDKTFNKKWRSEELVYFFSLCTYCMQISHLLSSSFLTAHTWGIKHKRRRTTVCYADVWYFTPNNSSHLHGQKYSVAYSSRTVDDHVSYPHKTIWVQLCIYLTLVCFYVYNIVLNFSFFPLWKRQYVTRLFQSLSHITLLPKLGAAKEISITRTISCNFTQEI